MKENFPTIVDEHFTANMESLLDGVGEGKVNWKTVIANFYPDLIKAVEAAEKDLDKVKIEDEVTDVICDECGRNMVIKYGPHGKFLACPNFPKCKNTKSLNDDGTIKEVEPPKETEEKCPQCGADLKHEMGCVTCTECGYSKCG